MVLGPVEIEGRPGYAVQCRWINNHWPNDTFEFETRSRAEKSRSDALIKTTTHPKVHVGPDGRAQAKVAHYSDDHDAVLQAVGSGLPTRIF